MEFIRIGENYLDELKQLQIRYKAEIGEKMPSDENFSHLRSAIKNSTIRFYGCLIENRLVACCSVATAFSTFNYLMGGIFEDFYILP